LIQIKYKNSKELLILLLTISNALFVLITEKHNCSNLVWKKLNSLVVKAANFYVVTSVLSKARDLIKWGDVQTVELISGITIKKNSWNLAKEVWENCKSSKMRNLSQITALAVKFSFLMLMKNSKNIKSKIINTIKTMIDNHLKIMKIIKILKSMKEILLNIFHQI